MSDQKKAGLNKKRKKKNSLHYIQGVDPTASNTAWGLGYSFSLLLFGSVLHRLFPFLDSVEWQNSGQQL